MIVADGLDFGSTRVHDETGQTTLETLYDTIMRRRPRELSQSRLELIWRSVAALHSARKKRREHLGDRPGSALVISFSRKVFWTTLKLRHWSPSNKTKGLIHIARSAIMEECAEDQAWMTQRASLVESILTKSNQDINSIKKWTRSIELLSAGMRPKSLAKIGMDMEALEHWCWPTPEGDWEVLHQRPAPKRWPSPALPPQLEEKIQSFIDSKKDPRVIVVESPFGTETTTKLALVVQNRAPNIPVVKVSNQDASKAALDLALKLGRDRSVPAWLDEVPSIELEVRPESTSSENSRAKIEWKAVVPRKQAIPAGEPYRTRPNISRSVTLAPGIEYVLLHLRRGDRKNWNERYTRHHIDPSDHKRVVEPLARVRPLSGEARIEIVEHLSQEKQLLTDVRWSEMETKPPPELGGIPELYIFKPDQRAWLELCSLLEQVVRLGNGNAQLRDKIYKTTQKNWRDAVFPLGSDGRPPKSESYELLEKSTQILLHDLEDHVNSQTILQPPIANRLHLPLTWLFTGCPTKTVEILLRAALSPEGPEGTALHVENEFSAWAIYQGIGRAIREDDALRQVFDGLLGQWVREGGTAQDKYLLAAVTHPLARRVSARLVLGESKDRFDRVANFLRQQLDNLLKGKSDPRPRAKGRSRRVRPQRSLELRYITMGYRGLCQVRYSHQDWFLHSGEDAESACENLCKAAKKYGQHFEKNLVDRTAPYLIGEGEDPTMPSGF